MELTANLEVFAGAEIVNMISNAKRTGVLYFDISGDKGELCFKEGVPVHASFKTLVGEEALYNLMIEKSGTASFKDNISVKDFTIHSENTSELMNQIEKRKVEFDDIASKLPPFDAVLEKRAEGIGENISLRKSDWAVIRIVNGKKTIKTIIKESKLPLLEGYKTLEYLLSKGMIFDRSQSERIKESFIQSLNSILEVFSIKGANSSDWANSIIDVMMSNGYETIGGMLKHDTEGFKAEEEILKVIDDEKASKIKKLVYTFSLEKGTKELGAMIAKKKYRELMQKEGVNDGTF